MKKEPEMLTAKKFAERVGVTYPTVISWLKKGLIPGARLMEDTPFGTYWQIPATSATRVRKQKPGPKKGSKRKMPAKKSDNGN